MPTTHQRSDKTFKRIFPLSPESCEFAFLVWKTRDTAVTSVWTSFPKNHRSSSQNRLLGNLHRIVSFSVYDTTWELILAATVWMETLKYGSIPCEMWRAKIFDLKSVKGPILLTWLHSSGLCTGPMYTRCNVSIGVFWTNVSAFTVSASKRDLWIIFHGMSVWTIRIMTAGRIYFLRAGNSPLSTASVCPARYTRVILRTTVMWLITMYHQIDYLYPCTAKIPNSSVFVFYRLSFPKNKSKKKATCMCPPYYIFKGCFFLNQICCLSWVVVGLMSHDSVLLLCVCVRVCAVHVSH